MSLPERDETHQIQGSAGTGFGSGFGGFIRRAVTAIVIFVAVLLLICIIMATLGYGWDLVFFFVSLYFMLR